MKKYILIFGLLLANASLFSQELKNNANWTETINYLTKNLPVLDHTYTIYYENDSPSKQDKKYTISGNKIINFNKYKEDKEGYSDAASLKALHKVTVNESVMKLYFVKNAVGRNNAAPHTNIMYLSLTKTASHVTGKSTYTLSSKSKKIQALYKAFNRLAYLADKRRNK